MDNSTAQIREVSDEKCRKRVLRIDRGVFWCSRNAGGGIFAAIVPDARTSGRGQPCCVEILEIEKKGLLRTLPDFDSCSKGAMQGLKLWGHRRICNVIYRVELLFLTMWRRDQG